MHRADNVLAHFFDNRISTVHTALPGKIEVYRPEQQNADILPVIKKKYRNGQVLDMPVLSNVPVCIPGGTSSVRFVPKAGEDVVVIFCERAIDRWKQTGQVSEPSDPRKFDLSDGIAIPGLVSFGNAPEVEDATILQYGAGRVKIDNSEKIAIGNSEAELFEQLTQLIQALETVDALSSIEPQLTEVREKLELIKGTL